MSQEIKKSLTLEISEDVLIKLKILALQKKIKHPELCANILEKFVSGKKGVELENKET